MEYKYCQRCGYAKVFRSEFCTDCIGKNQSVLFDVCEDFIKTREQSVQDQWYREREIINIISEKLIQELFISLKFKVVHSFMATKEQHNELFKGLNHDDIDIITQNSFLIVQNPISDEVNFFKVIFRANERFALKDVPENYNIENTLFIVISKRYIKCISFNELQMGLVLTAESKNFLRTRKEFKRYRMEISEFSEFAIKFFENCV